MVLFKVDSQRLTVPPRKCHTPGTVDMDTVSRRDSVKTMKVETWYVDFVQCFGLIQNVQPSQATLLKGRLNLAAATAFEQFGEAFVAKSPDHFQL